MASSRVTQVECREIGNLGDMLKCFRLRQSWAQKDLFDRSGISINAISDIERGNRMRLQPETVRLLSDALDLDAEDRAAFRALASGRSSAKKPVLPLPATSFLGREHAIDEVCRMLAELHGRLLTLTGPGGTGKTRLALRVAEVLAPSLVDGVFFVDLASVNDPQVVPGAIAQALGVPTPSGQPIDQVVIDYCVTRQILLVLDNFERLMLAAHFVNKLVADCLRVVALVTSREPLGLARERLFPVGGMTLPQRRPTADFDAASHSDAVQLFVARASAVQPSFRLSAENADDVSAICIGLDGLPLAIEIAAAQLAHVRSPASLLSRMDLRLPWLKSKVKDQAARHRTMRDAIAWSYDTLESADRAMFRRLAVFAGGFTVDAAESMLREENRTARLTVGTTREEVLDYIASLVWKNLIQLYDSPDGGTRYRMLETIREFGMEQLDATGEGDSVRAAFGRTFREFVERGELELTGPYQNEWMSRLEVESDNIRSAVTWAIKSYDADTAVRMGSALWRFWAASGRIIEGQRLMTDAIDIPGEVSPGMRASAVRRLGNLCVELADYRAARVQFESSLALAQDLGDEISIARALSSVGYVALNQGDYDDARRCLEEALKVWVGSEYDLDRAVTLQSLGQVAIGCYDFDAARHHLESSLRLRRANGNEIGAAFSLCWLGQLSRFEEKYDVARSHDLLALEGFKAGSEQLGEGNAIYELAMLARETETWDSAVQLMNESLSCRIAIGDVQGQIESFEGLGVLACDRGDYATAVQLFSAMEGWRTDKSMQPLAPARALRDRARAGACSSLGDSRFAANWAIGVTLTLSQLRRLTASSFGSGPSSVEQR